MNGSGDDRPQHRAHETPSRCTLFRWRLRSLSAGEAIADLSADLPGPIRALWQFRLKGTRQRMLASGSAAELVTLAGEAVPPADLDWLGKMRSWGDGALPALLAALREWPGISSASDAIALRNLAGAFAWTGASGATALTAALPELRADAASFASVVLGHLRWQPAADAIYRLHQSQVGLPDQRDFVGPLWGLVDLRDRRASGALACWLESGFRFYELFGLAYLCGEEGLIVPLLRELTTGGSRADRTDALMVLAAISSRIGRSGFEELLLREFGCEQEQDARQIAESVGSLSRDDVARYFEAFAP